MTGRLVFRRIGPAGVQLNSDAIALMESVARKRMLLREANHRFKNHLAMIAAMLRIQARSADTENAANQFRMIADRIASMSRLYEQLALSDSTDSVRLDTYLDDVVRALQQSVRRNQKIRLSAVPCEVAPSVAADIGLITNELVTNAIRHARDAEGAVEVHIALRAANHALLLDVADNGPGLPASFALHTGGLGTTIVQSLVAGLGGDISFDRQPGALFRIAIPLDVVRSAPVANLAAWGGRGSR